MPARRCLKCGINYPYRKGERVKCPECGDALQYSSHAIPDTEWPLEVKDELDELTAEEADEWSADWCALEAEVAKRGPKWTLADLIGEVPSEKAD